MAAKIPMTLKAALYGLSLAAIHFILSIGFGLYFGLGMNPDGANFALNYFMQPGTIVEKIHASANPLVVNVLFYFMAGMVIGLLRIRKDTSVADKQSN